MNDNHVLAEFNKKDRYHVYFCPLNNFSWQ